MPGRADSNIFERAIGHQVSEKPHRICKRSFSGLEPNDTRCHRKQVTIARQRLHEAAPRILLCSQYRVARKGAVGVGAGVIPTPRYCQGPSTLG
jgi:hypothetical protein